MASRKRTSTNRVIVMAVVLVLTSCGFLGGAVFWAGNSLESKAKSLPFHLDEARRLGLATSLSELRVAIKDPAEDAYPELRAAYKLWQKIPPQEAMSFRQLLRRTLRGQASAADRDAFGAALEKHKSLVGHIRAAASKQACSVPEVETWKHRRLYSYGTFQREAIRLLGAQAVLAGQAHDIARAEDWLKEGIALSKHLSAQPSYVGVSRRNVAELELQRALERIVHANLGSPVAMANLIERTQPRFGEMTSAADVLRYEPALMLHALSDPKKTGLENVPGGQFFADVGKSGSLEIWNRYYRKLPTDATEQSEAEKILIAMDKEAQDTPFYGPYVKGYDSIVPLLRDVLARRRLAEASVAYLRSGSLDELPIDPHSGNPLLWKKSPKGVVIYSVAEDQQDNGGQERQFGPDASPFYDLLARLPLVTPTIERS